MASHGVLSGSDRSERQDGCLIRRQSKQRRCSFRAGWDRGELDRIVADFLRSYGVPESSALRIEAKSDRALAITFPNDIEPKLLLFLINYVQYPRGLVIHVPKL